MTGPEMMQDWSIPTSFKCINPNGQEFFFDAEKWTLKRYQDISTNARDLQLTTKPEVPLQQFAEILAMDGAEVCFRGYVERYKRTQKESVWTCKGIENLLYHRFCHKWNYALVGNADGTGTVFTFNNVIKDHYSPVYPISYGNTDNCPGLLHVANSMMPWGMPFTVYDAVKHIIKYANWGAKSRLGAAPTLYYMDDAGIYPLTLRGALADLQSNDQSYFVDANDLYIRNTANLAVGNAIAGSPNITGAVDYWYWNGRILADNAFDTKLRIGSVEWGDTPLVGFLRTKHTDNIADVLFGIIKSFGLYPYLFDQPDATYIYGMTTFYEPDPYGVVYTIDEKDKETIAFECSVPNKPRVHCLRGYGDAGQVYSWANYDIKGIWYEDLFSVSHGYRDADGILQSGTNAEFTNRFEDYQYYIKTTRKIVARPGDLVAIRPALDGAFESSVNYPINLPINVITNRSDGYTELELNCKTPKLTNAWLNAGMLSNPYTNYLMEKTKDSVSASTTFAMRSSLFSTCAMGSVSLTCPDLSGPDENNPRVTLDVSISVTPAPPNQQTMDPWRCFVIISRDTYIGADSIIYNYAFGDTISDIDITDIVYHGHVNTIYITLYYMGNIQGSTNCSTNTNLTANVTMNFYKRLDLWG